MTWKLLVVSMCGAIERSLGEAGDGGVTAEELDDDDGDAGSASIDVHDTTPAPATALFQIGNDNVFTDVRAFHVDSIGNLYLVGRFAGTLDVDPGAGTVDLTSMGPETDIVIVKLDPAGTLVWARQPGGAGPKP
jgi:hypothetical protein